MRLRARVRRQALRGLPLLLTLSRLTAFKEVRVRLQLLLPASREATF